MIEGIPLCRLFYHITWTMWSFGKFYYLSPELFDFIGRFYVRRTSMLFAGL
jgi:hypothetical protein